MSYRTELGRCQWIRINAGQNWPQKRKKEEVNFWGAGGLSKSLDVLFGGNKKT